MQPSEAKQQLIERRGWGPGGPARSLSAQEAAAST